MTNPILNRVADGRRLASRSIVMTQISSIPCVVWRKKVNPITDGVEREDESWGGLGVLSESDEHAIEYEQLGLACLLLDRFTGGSVNSSRTLVDSGEESIIAQIEPYIDGLTGRELLVQLPEWVPKSGDMFGFLIGDDALIWLELVSIMGQSFMSDFGTKYLLNKRDNPISIEPFKTEFEERE
jgi:hypothetical protein